AITGLATIARGTIEAKYGVDPINPVITFGSLASAAATRTVAPNLTIPADSPMALLYQVMGSNAAEGTGQGFATTRNTAPDIVPVLDNNIRSLHVRAESSAAGIYHGIAEAVKVVRGDTNGTYRSATTTYTGDHVGIWAAFRPIYARVASSTRWYATAH